ncbi:MAG TPA: OmpH family outer membrane protein [Blastocatellia bacterium]|nr:OmpH family outer membrane protein [Blastocatellia bacterium]
MRSFRLALTAVALATIGVSASAQVTSGLTPQAGAAPAALPKGKVAVVNTAMFQGQVAEFKTKIEALNRQFETRVKEVQGLGEKIAALEATIKTQASTLSPAMVAEKTEQLATMKKDYQRKGEDLQADAGRARDKAFEPIQAKLLKFASQFTAARGIVLLVDLANGLRSGTLLWYDQRSDVTQDFINEYNKANPITATPTAPPKP